MHGIRMHGMKGDIQVLLQYVVAEMTPEYYKVAETQKDKINKKISKERNIGLEIGL